MLSTHVYVLPQGVPAVAARMTALPGRTENLLATCSLAITERLLAVVEGEGEIGTGGASAVVSLHTFLDGCSIDQLAGVVGLSHAGTVRLVDRLEAAALLRRPPSATDGRAVALTLTRQGHTLARKILQARREAMADVLSAIPASEQERFTTLLEALITKMTGDSVARQHMCRLCDVMSCGHPDSCPVTLSHRDGWPAASPG